MTQGAFETTENALDLAIDGDGFFSVSDSGARFYTRPGTSPSIATASS